MSAQSRWFTRFLPLKADRRTEQRCCQYSYEQALQLLRIEQSQC